MSRTTYPTLLRDHLGNTVHLPAKPFATGGEGAVFEVVNRHDLVAKLYSKPQSPERCDKLRAMAQLCSADLLKFAAWPIATLSNGNPGAVDGILMPRIRDHKEIHHLYSVAQRKKDFPEADWGFLLHTARNCAIAFETIHRSGHVVGDVNQKNVMVSKKGIVALVDCDSFQVREGNRIFRCGVGVPEYTPPELHGRRFTDLDRSANHDVFGLAVMIFHLLMMGRHPFSGVPQVNADIPIEKAIVDGFYAYSQTPNKLRPPPHVPPMAMLDAPTRDLFERAFGSTRRPTAAEWHRVLDDSFKTLQRCKNDWKHSYLSGARDCPWCQLITSAKIMFFTPGQGSAGATVRIEQIQKLIQKLDAMRLEGTPYTRPRPMLPVVVTLPANLRAIQKPVLLLHSAPPSEVPEPLRLPAPSPPVLLPRPSLLPLPPAPYVPPQPSIKGYPAPPPEPPPPLLHQKPPPPGYPPVPVAGPSDPFLQNFCIAGAMTAVPVFFIAWPVSLIMLFGFGIWWLLIALTEGHRRMKAQSALTQAHAEECKLIDSCYERKVQPITDANNRLIEAWEQAKAVRAAQIQRIAAEIDEENRVTLAPWLATKNRLREEHKRKTQEIKEANRRTLSAWQTENDRRHAAHAEASQKIDRENEKSRMSWQQLTAYTKAKYQQECREIDEKNRQTISDWELANPLWVREIRRWRERGVLALAEISRLENEIEFQRAEASVRFTDRKEEARGLLSSFSETLNDYYREVQQAELNSKRTQLEQHLEKSLIRKASLKGITASRLLALESFGVETAKDVDLLATTKIPGIGQVLTQRLIDWRNNLSSTFWAQPGLPASEKRRIDTRFAPALLPFRQALSTTISDLDAIAASQRARQEQLEKLIRAAVQELAIADANVRAMDLA